MEEKKVVRYALSTKAISITIANFEEVVDLIKDEEITSRVLEVREVFPPKKRNFMKKFHTGCFF